MLNAFCRVAPSVRFISLAIFLAGVFFRASDFNSRTSSGVHVRLFFAMFGSPIIKMMLAYSQN